MAIISGKDTYWTAKRGIVQNGLVLHLDAAVRSSYPETGTTWYDLSGNNNHGTLNNGPTFTNDNGGNISFDGVDDHINLGSLLLNTSSGTIGFWIKFTNTITVGYSGNQRPFGNNADFEMRWNTSTNTNRTLIFDIAGSDNLQSTSRDWLNSLWYYIVTTWNSSITTSSLYINNLLDSTGNTGSTATLTALTGTLYIGRSANGGYVNGNIPIFQAYNRVLSSIEISQNFNATRKRFGL